MDLIPFLPKYLFFVPQSPLQEAFCFTQKGSPFGVGGKCGSKFWKAVKFLEKEKHAFPQYRISHFQLQSPVPKFERAKYINHPCMEVAIGDPLLFWVLSPCWLMVVGDRSLPGLSS